jgi:hypothetical protein
MMRTIEIILVITILLGAFLIASYFAVLPSPRNVSSINLKKLAATTLQTLDSDYSLSETVFKNGTDPAWGQLQTALSSCLPPNIIYNLTVYDMLGLSGELYSASHSITNAESLGTTSKVTSYLAASSNVKFNITPQRINKTLYILNCSDSNGWWITGYTPSTLAEDLYRLLSPYFQITIPVNTTAQLEQILSSIKISSSPEENITGAVVINTCGEAVPIPNGYNATDVGYDAGNSSYALYCRTLGKKVHDYNWTWASIVGYPFYYVSNTVLFSSYQNDWGIYGMKSVGAAGLNSFLLGLNNTPYYYNSTWITGDEKKDSRLASVQLSSDTLQSCNTYGIYPAPYHTATRALPTYIRNSYNLTVTSYILEQVGDWIAGAVYSHYMSGHFLQLGLARTPDIRLTALGLLSFFKPQLQRSNYEVAGTSKFVVLQLGQAGGK